MSRLSKIIYGTMLLLSLTSIITNLIEANYEYALIYIGTLCWVGVAFVMELKCIKLEKQIENLHGNN
jgi:hypothetical protein